jgi:hypothetical protein
MTKTSSSAAHRRFFSGTAFALALAVGTLAPCSPALAQQRSAADIAQARELFNEGTDLREKGDIAGALEKLRAAHALAGTPITGLELGRTYASAGKLVEAREVLLGVGRIPVSAQETSRSAAARKSAAQLAEQVRPRIPRLSVRVTGAPLDAVTVSIDGVAVASEALSAPRLVNPGKHDVVAVPSSGERATAAVELKEGESRDVELRVTLAAAPSASSAAVGSGAARAGAAGAGATGAGAAGDASGSEGASGDTPPATPTSASRVFFWGGLGLAAAGVAAGAATGIVAMGKASSVNDACHNTLTCPTSIDADLHTGRTMGTVSTIAFAVAGAGAVTAIVAFFVGRKDEGAPPPATAWVAPWAAPGGGGVNGALRF